jgi:hypothetical protein
VPKKLPTFITLKIHSITCISDNFSEDEIASAELFVMNKLSPIANNLKRKSGTVVLFIQSDKIRYKVIGFSPLYKLRIENLLRDNE